MSTLRVAVAGKGGAGKTTLSATLARVAARRGRRVLVIDADSNPNVAVALGIPRDVAAGIGVLPSGLVSRKLNGPSLIEPVADIVERHGVTAPDGVCVVHMAMPAHADEGCLCSAHATVSAMLADSASAGETVVIVDFEASPEHFSRGTARHVDALLLVVEPYYRSLETARRMAELAAQLPIPRLGVVANKLRSAEDAEAIEQFCSNHDLRVEMCVPWSDAVLDADRDGVPLIEFPAGSDVVEAIERLATTLLN